MNQFHTIFIGGGINSLVAAAILSKQGKKVLILERTKYLGGCIRSDNIQGCVIDTMSTAYPLFVTAPAYQILKSDLEKYGVEFISNDTPTASVLQDKRFAIFKTNRNENIQTFNALSNGDGDAYDSQMKWVLQHSEFLFTLLGNEMISTKMSKFILKYWWKNGFFQSLKNVADFSPSIRNDLSNYFKSKEILAIMTPWILHTGLSPESIFSSIMSKIIMLTIEMAGLPMIKGGSYKIVDAMKNIIENKGGTCLTEKHVEQIIVNEHAIATGVKCNNDEIYSSKYVVASTTPTQLYENLLDKKFVPQDTQTKVKQYKYGKGNMQIHLILNEKPLWFDKALNNVVYVHLSDGIDNVSQAVNEATRQQLPQYATICIAQPTALDPSRTSEGKHVLWIQLPECPNFPIGDATNKLNALTKGEWTNELKEAYADKIIARVSDYISNIKTACVYRQVISPKDLHLMNINLMNGDPYAGLCEINQYMMWRPLSTQKNHSTPIKNVFHIGASTHPGPGLSGGSGFHIAQKLKNK